MTDTQNLTPRPTATTPEQHLQSGFGQAVLAGLQRLPHIYGGTVDPVVIEQRRAANRRARKARRAHRLAARR